MLTLYRRLRRAGNGAPPPGCPGMRRRSHPIRTPNGDHRSGQARLWSVEHGGHAAAGDLEALSRPPAITGL